MMHAVALKSFACCSMVATAGVRWCFCCGSRLQAGLQPSQGGRMATGAGGWKWRRKSGCSCNVLNGGWDALMQHFQRFLQHHHARVQEVWSEVSSALTVPVALCLLMRVLCGAALHLVRIVCSAFTGADSPGSSTHQSGEGVHTVPRATRSTEPSASRWKV
jgi:hypothetical protein